jgi:hypothetical protein
MAAAQPLSRSCSLLILERQAMRQFWTLVASPAILLSASMVGSGSRDWTVRVWDVETGHETARNTTHQYAPATRNRAARCTRHAMGHPPEALGRV